MKEIQARYEFKKLLEGIEQYAQGVTSTAEQFRRDYAAAVADCAPYKDERKRLADKRTKLAAKARQDINKHGQDLGEVAASCVKSLSECVENHLCRPVPAATEKLLNLYSRYRLPLSESELQALVTVNGGHVLGLRLINAMLEETGSGWRLDFIPLSQYEQDIRDLKRLAVMAQYEPAFPTEYLGEACLIFCGQNEREIVRAPQASIGRERDYDPAGDMLRTNTLNEAAHVYQYDEITGTAADIGTMMNELYLTAAGGRFADLIKRIKGDEQGERLAMASYWSADIGHSAQDLNLRDETVPDPVSGTKIKPANEAKAQDLGKEAAKHSPTAAAETMQLAGMK